MSLRVVFMGTPTFAVPTLEALLAAGFEVVAAYSQPPRPAGRGQKLTPSLVQLLAEKYGIPVHVPVSLKSAESQEIFRSHQADVAVVAAYGLLLPQAILDAPTHGCLNVHPSKLPRWRGAAPIQRAVIAGDVETALCIMKMEAGLDTGPIALQRDVPIPPTATAGDMHDTLAALGGEMMVEALRKLAAGALHFTPQSQHGVVYAAKITKEDARIDWKKPAAEIYNQIRGLSPAPGAVTTLKNTPMKILAAEILEAPLPTSPRSRGEDYEYGTVLDDQLTIQCGGGSLRPTRVTWPGKRAMETAEFLRGQPVPAGTVLK